MRSKAAVAIGAAAACVAAATLWLVLAHREEQPKSRQQVIAEIDAELAGLAPKGFAGSVLLEQDGVVLLDKGYGPADRSSGRAVTPDTGFDVGSLVKPFTAAAVIRLESLGKLRRTDPIGRFLPGAPDDKARITVQQLLSHSSGLPDLVDSDGKPWEYTTDVDYEPVSREEIVRRALRARLRFAPGARSEYSNLGYSLLGAIVEIASGEPYETFVRRAIFEPAGMARTGYLAPGWHASELAVGYVGGTPWGTPLDHPWLADGPSWNLRANGGMLSTTGDLLKWIRALDGSTVLDYEEKRALFDLYVHRNKRGARTMGAAGSNGVFDATYLWYPDERRTLIMLTNSDRWRAEKMVPDLAKRLLSVRTPDR